MLIELLQIFREASCFRYPWRSPTYFRDVCVPVVSVPFRPQLCSADNDVMIVPRTRTVHYGPCSYHVKGEFTGWRGLAPGLSPLEVKNSFFALIFNVNIYVVKFEHF